MNPIHASTLSAITAAVRRHYLRTLELVPAPGDPARWTIQIKDRREPLPTEVVLRDGTYTFQDKPARPRPQWDREIPAEQ
jgi:hypothetical protein